MELLQLRLRFFVSEVVLLGLDLRQHVVLDELQLRLGERVFRQLQRAVVARCGRDFVRFPLLDLLFEIDEIGAAIERVPQLLLSIEFDEHVARLHRRAVVHEAHDDEGVVVLSGESRRLDRRGLDRLDRAVEPDSAHEVLPLDHERRRRAGPRGLSRADAQRQPRRGDCGDREQEGGEEIRPFGHVAQASR